MQNQPLQKPQQQEVTVKVHGKNSCYKCIGENIYISPKLYLTERILFLSINFYFLVFLNYRKVTKIFIIVFV